MLSRVSTTTERTSAWPALAGGPQFVAIDSNGNLASKVEDGHSWTYEWNAENQLKRVLKDAAEVARFSYDPLGRRVEKVGSAATTYTYDGQDLLRRSSGAVAVRYVHGEGIDQPLAAENGSGQLTYEHADGLGSELKTTDSTGAVTSSRSYGAFGQLQSGATTDGFAFTGREWDPEIQAYYYRARYYDAAVGRFLSEDPIRGFGGPNFYTYVRNAPTRLVDPSGLQALAPQPPNMVPGTNSNFWTPFEDGFAEALNRLNRATCTNLFAPTPCVCTSPEQVMKNTTYRVVGFPQGPGVGAATVNQSTVFLNSTGAFFGATGGGVRLGNGTRHSFSNAIEVRGFILLHELGHQMKSCSGFVPDLNPATNEAHSLAVIKACF